MSSSRPDEGPSSPVVDSRPLEMVRSQTESSSVAPRDTDAGAWPEDTPLRFFADSSLTIPGVGTKPASCGVWRPAEFCGECGEPQLSVSRCGLRHCPGCWMDWVSTSTNRIVRRLQAARHVAKAGLAKRAVHVVASPPPGSVKTLQHFYDMVKEAYDLAKAKGVRGGVAIPHGWRVKEEIKQIWRLQYADEWQGGIWSWIRENERDWRTQTYWSPHVHIIGLSEDVEGNDPDGDLGWVFKRIRTMYRYDIADEQSYNDLIGAAHYVLTHATFDAQESKQAVRWFGTLAPAAFSPPKALDRHDLETIESMTEAVQYTNSDEDSEHTCEECGSEDLHPIWDAGLALQNHEWCDGIGRDQQRRLLAAFEWAIGERMPPPGLKHPGSKAEAQNVLRRLT